MRVLFVDHETRLSGGQQDLLDLVRALPPGVEVHAAVPGCGPLEQALRQSGAAVHLLPMAHGLRSLSRWALVRRPHLALTTLASFVAASLRTGRLVRAVRPDIVHTNSMKSHLLAIAPARLRRIPLVWHVRDIIEPGWLRSALATLGALFPSRIVCLSQAAAAQFEESRRARAKTRVVYNGIPIERFERADGAALRRKLGAVQGDILVGIVGQIAWWKGHDVFVEAASRLAAERPRVRFVVIGDCLFPENESRFVQSLHDRAQAAGLGDRLAWTGWCDDVGDAIASLDVLVHASRLPEPFGRVLVEGMAAGKPVVASAAGAVPEIVPLSAGRLVPPGDAPALERALAELIDDPAERRWCATAAREAARRFDIGNTARGVLAVYAEVGACA